MYGMAYLAPDNTMCYANGIGEGWFDGYCASSAIHCIDL